MLRNGTYTRLDTLAGFGGTLGAAVNNRGVVAGWVPHPTSTSINYAVRWEGGTIAALGALPTVNDHRARAVDNSGRIAGTAVGSNINTSFLWQNGVMTNLGSLPGGTGSDARDINDSGVVVGLAFGAQIGQRAYRWAGGTMQDLGVLPGGNGALAVAINDSGAILGQLGR